MRILNDKDGEGPLNKGTILLALFPGLPTSHVDLVVLQPFLALSWRLAQPFPFGWAYRIAWPHSSCSRAPSLALSLGPAVAGCSGTYSDSGSMDLSLLSQSTESECHPGNQNYTNQLNTTPCSTGYPLPTLQTKLSSYTQSRAIWVWSWSSKSKVSYQGLGRCPLRPWVWG